MRTVAYNEILQKATEATGRIYADLSVQEAGLLKGFINTRLRHIWELKDWPDLVPVEERFFRADWSSGTTYAASAAGAAVEVFYPPAQKYYQSVKAANLNNAPADRKSTRLNSSH